MKEALQNVLEPLLLTQAGALARALPAERRSRVQELSRAARLRERLAREAREPEALPAALCLGREAFSLSVSALLAAGGELSGQALGPAAAWQAARERGLPMASELERLMTTDDPAFADSLDTDTQRRLLQAQDELLATLRARYEPRTTRQLMLSRVLRLTLLLALVTACLLVLLALMVRP